MSERFSLDRGFIPSPRPATLLAERYVRRLFWTFATGVPGAGLLVMRLVITAALVLRGLDQLWARPLAGGAWTSVFQIAVGLLFLLGLWTPIAGIAVVLLEGWHLAAHSPDPWSHILLATIGIALALLGPGAWSVDARLFGWKRIQIRERSVR
jgi:uncharacterized membrane protein YphA (DoxX/SURF4 family)